MKLADADGDGDLDIFITNDGISAGEFSQLHFNNGNGVFDFSQNMGNLILNTKAIALGDVDGDGDLDAALAIQQNTIQGEFQIGSGINRIQLNALPPEVTDRSPEPHNYQANQKNNIEILFDRSIEFPAVGDVVIHGKQTGNRSALITLDNQTEVALNPSVDFYPGEQIEVSVTEKIISTAGINLANPKVWRFHTESTQRNVTFANKLQSISHSQGNTHSAVFW